jgi:hypothetical protein
MVFNDHQFPTIMTASLFSKLKRRPAAAPIKKAADQSPPLNRLREASA